MDHQAEGGGGPGLRARGAELGTQREGERESRGSQVGTQSFELGAQTGSGAPGTALGGLGAWSPELGPHCLEPGAPLKIDCNFKKSPGAAPLDPQQN